jgi:uncharacterized membrane protein YfcA
MSAVSLAVYCLASLDAGIVNAIAGGGSFMTFPALLFTGLDPRAANMTSTIALFPMQISAGYSGRAMAGGTPHLTLKQLVIISLLGGLVGAVLLLMTPPASFARLVPWLILFATAIFAYSSFRKKSILAEGATHLGFRGSALAQFGISIYGGYFGGGIGFLMLAALTLGGMAIRKAGATKNILAGVMNAAAVLIFMFSHDIGWVQVGVGAVASVVGGLIGVRLLSRVNEKLLRIAVVIIGSCLTVAMFMYAP